MDSLEEIKQVVEDIYPLAPMQQLFYSLSASKSGVGVEQYRFTLRGPLQVPHFQRAWQSVVERHAILRTAFVSEDLNEPMQVVFKQVDLPWIVEDWSGDSEARQAERLQEFLKADLARGFELAQAPLMRMAMLRLSADTWHFVWSLHHLILDGVSWPIVFREAALFNDAYHQDQSVNLPPAPLYRDFIAWLKQRDPAIDEVFWRQNLRGISDHDPLQQIEKENSEPSRSADFDYGEQKIKLNEITSRALRQYARENHITISTIVQGAWALLLGHRSGGREVVYGTTVAGRPADLPGSEAMVGLFINNLPVRLALDRESPVTAWLGQVQDRLAELREHETTPLLKIQEYSGLPPRRRLFETLVVFNNYQADGPLLSEFGSSLKILEAASPVRTNYPLTLMAHEDGQCCLSLWYHTNRVAPETAALILDDIQKLLKGMVSEPGQTLGQLLESLPLPLRFDLEPEAKEKEKGGESAAKEEQRAYMAARNALEQQLAGIWEKVFGVKPIGMQDNFFELGGQSLIAVKLFAEIEKRFHRSLPLATLFQAPTVAQLAQIMQQDGWEPPWSCLVAIQPGGTKPPFYCVHGVGGNIVEYLHLARSLGPDQPFYGLQAQGLDGKKPWLTRVEDMAAQYIKEIRAFQPEGPYYLGGSSFGGMVAYEMALQLQAQGQETALLAFFDTNGPDYPRYLPTTTAFRRRLYKYRTNFDVHWSNLRLLKGRDRIEYVRDKYARVQRYFWKKKKRLIQWWRRRVVQLTLPETLRKVQNSGNQALEAYHPKPYPGKVTLFRATEQPYGIYYDRTLGWGSLVQGGLEIIDIPGHHGSIIREPRVGYLAQNLKECIERCQDRNKTGGEEVLAR